MKRIIVPFLFILTLLCNNPNVFADQLISLFLKPYPEISHPKAAQTLGKKIHKVGKLSSSQAKHYLPAPISGIFATYGGFLTVSDLVGEMSFPRKHSTPFIYLIITERLTPIVMSGNTIHHWELDSGYPAEVYKLEQKWDDTLHVHYWDVMQEPAPANNSIPLESIVIIADPKYVYVPVGITLFKESPHLLLPDIYIKKGINLTADALYMVNLSHYFGPIIPMYKKEKAGYSTHLTY